MRVERLIRLREALEVVLASSGELRRIAFNVGLETGRDGLRDEIVAAIDRMTPDLRLSLEVCTTAERSRYADPEISKRLAPVPGGNAKPFQTKIIGQVARLWEKLGGTVDQSSGYSTYFHAAVAPIFGDREVRALTGSNLSEGLFHGHVRRWMRARQTVGRRGRSRVN